MNGKKPNICFIGNMLGGQPGYSNTQGQILAELFAANGYNVDCVSGKVNRFFRFADIVKTLFAGRSKFDLVVLDVYSGFYFVLADFVGKFCRINKLPLVMVLHGGALPQMIEKYPRWSRQVLSRANQIVSPSRYLAMSVEAFGFNSIVISNVVDVTIFDYKERNHIAPRLMWMRSFHSIYNPLMAVKVLHQLCSTEPDAEMTLAGSDKGMESEVRAYAASLGLSEKVRFTGFLDDDKKVQEFARADIFINTNRIDNMPVSIIEARAAGLPVVATSVGGVKYVIDNEENGLLVPDDDDHQMTLSIKRLLADRELTKKISFNGRKCAEESSWPAVREKWENLFQQLLDNS